MSQIAVGETALMLAAERGHFQAVHSLLEAGAKTDCTERDGKTAVMLASVAGHFKIARLLLFVWC